jgi:hypothetical protein
VWQSRYYSESHRPESSQSRKIYAQTPDSSNIINIIPNFESIPVRFWPIQIRIRGSVRKSTVTDSAKNTYTVPVYIRLRERITGTFMCFHIGASHEVLPVVTFILRYAEFYFHDL